MIRVFIFLLIMAGITAIILLEYRRWAKSVEEEARYVAGVLERLSKEDQLSDFLNKHTNLVWMTSAREYPKGSIVYFGRKFYIAEQHIPTVIRINNSQYWNDSRITFDGHFLRDLDKED